MKTYYAIVSEDLNTKNVVAMARKFEDIVKHIERATKIYDGSRPVTVVEFTIEEIN